MLAYFGSILLARLRARGRGRGASAVADAARRVGADSVPFDRAESQPGAAPRPVAGLAETPRRRGVAGPRVLDVVADLVIGAIRRTNSGSDPMPKGAPVRLRTWMAAHRRELIFATCLMVGTLVHGSAEASRNRRATVFLDGYVGTAPEGTATQASIVLQISGKRHDFAVTTTGVIKGGNRSARQILNDLRTKQNVLILTGPEATLGTLGTTPPGQLVRITGAHRRGSNQLSVTSIGPPPAPSGAASAPAAGDK